MQLVLKNGEIKEVNTSTMFNNQYNTVDGERIYDTAVQYIIDDIRLGEFYCSSVKQGTYDEVVQAIAEERAKINKCESCSWYHNYTRVEDECKRDREEIVVGNRKIISEQHRTVYEISCAYMPHYGNKCVHDIDETPKLFREAQQCFFCEYPQGVPDMRPLREFMVANAEKYGIVPRWSNERVSINTSFKHDRPFGSYEFESSWRGGMFELSNARNHFKFYIDLTNKKFILYDGIGYKVAKKLTERKHDYDAQTRIYKSYDAPITNYDKFAKWIWQIVDDFNANK